MELLLLFLLLVIRVTKTGSGSRDTRDQGLKTSPVPRPQPFQGLVCGFLEEGKGWHRAVDDGVADLDDTGGQF